MDENTKDTTVKEREFAKDVELSITGVEVLTNQKVPEEVAKLVFETADGELISYKPKRNVETFRDGLKIITVEPSLIADLPTVVKEIGKEVMARGVAKVKASYGVWNTEADGKPVTYRFVQGSKMMDGWKLLKAEEEVVA